MKYKGPLILTPAENGGWILASRPADFGDRGQTLGAFTSADDLLAELEAMLVGTRELDLPDVPGGIMRQRRAAPTWALPETEANA